MAFPQKILERTGERLTIVIRSFAKGDIIKHLCRKEGILCYLILAYFGQVFWKKMGMAK